MVEYTNIVYGTASVYLDEGWYGIDELIRDLQKTKEIQDNALAHSMKPTTPNPEQTRAPEGQE
jgi:hypothetical protein